MIDIHCHILPEIDDGASSMEESLKLARQAVADGITHIVTTPHFRYPIDNAQQLVRRGEALAKLRTQVAQENLPLEFLEGGEFQIDENPLETLRAFPEIGYLDASHRRTAVLMELLPESDILRAGDIHFQAQLQENFLGPIVIAHPEFQPGFLEQLEAMKQLLDRGLSFQFNALTFRHTFWGRRQIRTALALMEHAPDQVYLATDAHDSKLRPCQLSFARKPIVAALGEAFWHHLTWENPHRLLMP